jgi:hypothetical protein
MILSYSMVQNFRTQHYVALVSLLRHMFVQLLYCYC